jgi:hypothetical protein
MHAETEPAQAASDAGTPVNPPAVATAPPAQPAHSPQGQAESSPSVKPVPAKGSLLVKAFPYATVFVNGDKLGDVTGRGTFKLAPGDYELTFKHPKGSKTESITIKPNATVTSVFRAP